MLKIDKDLKDDTLTILLDGRLDTLTAPLLEDEIKAIDENVKHLIINMTMLNYISSAGLRLMLSAQKKMNKQGDMIIKGANETLKEIFEVTGFIDILDFV